MFTSITCRARASVRAWVLRKACGLVGKFLSCKYTPSKFMCYQSCNELMRHAQGGDQL